MILFGWITLSDEVVLVGSRLRGGYFAHFPYIFYSSGSEAYTVEELAMYCEAKRGRRSLLVEDEATYVRL